MLIKRMIPILLLSLLVIGVVACQSNSADEMTGALEAEEPPASEPPADEVDTDALGHSEQAKAELAEAELVEAEEESPHEDDDDSLYNAELPEELLPKPVMLDTGPEAVAFAMGNPDAPVQIVEFTDYQCPYCQYHALETMPALIEQMVESGRIFYAIKDLPLDRIHPEARSASVAARCAGEQDAYLPMHDAIFAAQADWQGKSDEAGIIFTGLAEGLELDIDTFTFCLDEASQAEKVQANVDEAMSLGIEGTPFFFVDGYGISGALPYEAFEMAVVLAEQGELDDAIEAQARQVYAQLMEPPQGPPQASPQPAEPVMVSLDDAFTIGDPNAPVTIVEYTDYQCPFCARHALQTFDQIAEELVESGQVRYVFKDMPLASIHPQATLAAEAARCAAAQDTDLYVPMHGLLFENQGSWSGKANAADLFAGYAGEIGLDGGAFATCLEDGDFEAAVQADVDEAMDLGINGTPAFLINGQLLFGAQPYEVFEQAVEILVAEA